MTIDTFCRDRVRIPSGADIRQNALMRTIFIATLAAALLACNAKQQTPAQAPPQTQPAQMQSSAAPASASRIVTGPVLESMNSGGYTYMRVGTNTGDLWAAVPETKIAKGSTVSLNVQMMMDNFESNTLHRKFDHLAFATLANGAAPPVQPPSMASSTPAATTNEVIPKAAGGKTIAEVYSQKSDLAGKSVVVRGKVVKALGGIMGKNWLHIHDGSGDHAKGTDDLTVTTNQIAKIGDVITVTGTLAVDKDFGAGYKYPAIIEDAKLQP